MIKVDTEPVNLETVLARKLYEVPLYQREFSWEIDEVSELYHDISASEKGHFFGTLLFAEAEIEKDKFEIIDGQQRLMTLFLLLSSLRSLIQKEDSNYAELDKVLFDIPSSYIPASSASGRILTPRLTASRRDDNLFRGIITEVRSQLPDKRKKSHRGIVKAKDYFDEKVEDIKTKSGVDGLYQLVEKTMHKSLFIRMTAESNPDKVLLFKTLNARGLELSIADLVKNEICHQPKHIEIDEAIDLWDEVRERLENAGADIEKFLFHHINSLERDQEIRNGIETKKGKSTTDIFYAPPIPEEYLFDAYEYELKKAEKTHTFLNEIGGSAISYSSFVKPETNAKHLRALKELNATRCYPLLLHAKRILNDSGFKKLCSAIEILTFRHNTINQKDAKELEKFYYVFINEPKTSKYLSNILEKIRKHDSMSSDELFKLNFLNADPKLSVSKFILCRIISQMQEPIDWKDSEVHLEHIMPKSPSSSWPEAKKDEEKHKDYLDRLGNLTILKDDWNRALSNKDYSEKIKRYKDSRITITNDIPKKWGVWNFESIEKRQEYLWELAKDIWSPNKIVLKEK